MERNKFVIGNFLSISKLFFVLCLGSLCNILVFLLIKTVISYRFTISVSCGSTFGMDTDDIHHRLRTHGTTSLPSLFPPISFLIDFFRRLVVPVGLCSYPYDCVVGGYSLFTCSYTDYYFLIVFNYSIDLHFPSSTMCHKHTHKKLFLV